MNNIITKLAALIILLSCLSCASNKIDDTKNANRWQYEIETVGQGTTNNYMIKVWTYTRNPDKVSEQTKKNAVHAIIFRGYAQNGRIPGQNPLVTNSAIEQEKKEYFDSFFKDGGQYIKFVNLTNNGSMDAGDRIKIGKEYKIGMMVTVNTNLLRKELEAAGIIKGLSSGF